MEESNVICFLGFINNLFDLNHFVTLANSVLILFCKAMVTTQSGDRLISSLLGRHWNLGIAPRILEKKSSRL